MNLQERIDLLTCLGGYMGSDDPQWLAARHKAYNDNHWFTEEFVQLAIDNIRTAFLQRAALQELAQRYDIPDEPESPKTVGLVLAGNIPLVGFHDILCTFISGQRAAIKLSSKDTALPTALVRKAIELYPAAAERLVIADRIAGCDAYIATGSNNTSAYFDHYFGKYPHIIRRNRTSVALLQGSETQEDLDKLAGDICQYFGLGCRNVTQLLMPEGYDFVPLLRALDRFAYLADHNKFKNNYDYYLASLILDRRFYMTNGSVLLVEAESPFAPVGLLHYRFYKNLEEAENSLAGRDDIQAIVGRGHTPFGGAQRPTVDTFADGADTLRFLLDL